MDWGSSDAAEICADTVAISAMSCDETLLLPGIRYRLPTRDGGKSACRHRMLSTRHRRKSMLRHLRTVCGIGSLLNLVGWRPATRFCSAVSSGRGRSATR